jgi:hypothetical protein
LGWRRVVRGQVVIFAEFVEEVGWEGQVVIYANFGWGRGWGIWEQFLTCGMGKCKSTLLL